VGPEDLDPGAGHRADVRPGHALLDGHHLAFELGNAELLSIDGFGHCSQASVCAANARNTYLLTQQLPAPGSRCGQDAAPFPAPSAA